MDWKEVQETCEKRIRELVRQREKGFVKDFITWRSTVESNENMRKVAIESQGRKYGGKFLKIEDGHYGVTPYSLGGQ